MASRFDQFFSPTMALNNGTTLRDTYATATGSSTGQIATGQNSGVPARASGVQPMQNDEVAQAAQLGGQVNPVIGGVIFIALVAGLMFVARKFGPPDDDFKSFRPSIYNAVFVGLTAAAGLPLLKFAAVKFKIPGVTNWILAA